MATKGAGDRRRRSPVPGVVAIAIAAAGLVGCTPGPPPDGRPPTATHCEVLDRDTQPGPGRRVRPEEFGADGRDRLDDTAALQAALDSLGDGDTLVLDAGTTYRHADVLHVRRNGSAVFGPGRLLATTEAASAVFVDGHHVTLGNRLVVAATTPTRRWDAYEQMKIVVFGDDAELDNLLVDRSAAAGIFFAGAAGFTATDVAVRDTMADGVHISDGASNGTVVQPRACRTGDDGVAVVSYADQAVVRGIVVDAPMVRDQTHGRGVSVVGGEDIEYRDIAVIRSNGASVYIAAEAEYRTHGVRDVKVLGGTVTGANTDPVRTAHGAVVVYDSQPGARIEDVTIAGLAITDTDLGAPRQVGLVGDGARIARITMRDLAITGGPANVLETVTPGEPTISGWTVDGRPFTG